MIDDKTKIASRYSWEILPMPKWKSRLSLKRLFTQDEFENLAKGVIPESMDDKWFIFFENDWLNFHRSWTGFCIYQVKIINNGNRYEITEAWVNRNLRQYKNIFKTFDKFLLGLLIDNFSKTKNV